MRCSMKVTRSRDLWDGRLPSSTRQPFRLLLILRIVVSFSFHKFRNSTVRRALYYIKSSFCSCELGSREIALYRGDSNQVILYTIMWAKWYRLNTYTCTEYENVTILCAHILWWAAHCKKSQLFSERSHRNITDEGSTTRVCASRTGRCHKSKDAMTEVECKWVEEHRVRPCQTERAPRQLAEHENLQKETGLTDRYLCDRLPRDGRRKETR